MFSPEILHYITNYGYWAIFLLVFLQEVGAPNPLPNELLLIFAGYLAFSGILSFFGVVLTALGADLLGTSVLYLLSLIFGNYVFNSKPKWLPIPFGKIEKLKEKVTKKGMSGIFIGRLSPFIRGYLSVITGLLQVVPIKYFPIAITTALIWSLAYVVTGYLLGPYWAAALPYLQNISGIMIAMFLIIMTVTVGRILFEKKVRLSN